MLNMNEDTVTLEKKDHVKTQIEGFRQRISKSREKMANRFFEMRACEPE